MKTELIGVIANIFPLEHVGGNNMPKRVLWLSEVKTSSRQYPNTWELEFLHDDVFAIDKHKVGDAVKISCWVRGAKWTPRGTNEERVRISLRGFNIVKVDPKEVV